jgi:hypothetical protein
VEEGRKGRKKGKKLCYFILEKLKIWDIFYLYKSNNKLEKFWLINFDSEKNFPKFL